jgi:hypothetical protein
MSSISRAAMRAFAAALLAAPAFVHAQASPAAPALTAAAAEACLTPSAAERGIPRYPIEAWEAGVQGEVALRLRFTAPDAPPVVEVEGVAADPRLVSSVKEHVQRFRLPCLGVGAEATVPMRFRFEMLPATAGSAAPPLSPLVECLTPPPEQRGQPAYPEKAFEARLGDTVVVDLVFSAPDRAPRVKRVGGPDFEDDFERAVREHARDFRLPCLVRGVSDTPVTLRQTYRFVPTDGRRVFGSTPSDTQAQARSRLVSCVSAPSRTTIAYPIAARRSEVQGAVIVKLRFEARDRPPVVEVLERPPERGSAALEDEVRKYASKMRLPCLDDQTFDTVFTFHFRLEGAARLVMRDLPLQTLIAGVKGIRAANVYLDLNAMGCPFDVQFALRRPFIDNDVSEIETRNPAREPLLDWLRRVEFVLPPAERNAIHGQPFVVRIPCGVIDLGPRTGGTGGS